MALSFMGDTVRFDGYNTWIGDYVAQPCICCEKLITVETCHKTPSGGALFVCRQCFVRYGWNYREYGTPKWQAAWKETEERNSTRPLTLPTGVSPDVTRW